MKKYFYSNGNERHGPVSFNELEQENITNNTLIWFEGLDDWTPADDLTEMKPILELKPPPISIQEAEPESENKDEKSTQNPEFESQDYTSSNYKQIMFSKPFSFEGRIRRMEYAISLIIYLFLVVIVNSIVESGEAPMLGLSYIPLLWFLWGQGAKRCHDIGQSGWFQIIPFYFLWMIFATGERGLNKYGVNPIG